MQVQRLTQRPLTQRPRLLTRTRARRAPQVRNGRAELAPLCLEAASGLWLEAGHGDASLGVSAPLGSLTRLDAAFAQRAVPDRVSNPHGEHAENTWQLLGELPAAVAAALQAEQRRTASEG